jgi:hypothetical protein
LLNLDDTGGAEMHAMNKTVVTPLVDVPYSAGGFAEVTRAARREPGAWSTSRRRRCMTEVCLARIAAWCERLLGVCSTQSFPH